MPSPLLVLLVAASNTCALQDSTGTQDWFCQQRAIDLTGDGAPDTVTIRAVGPSSDSLLVTLSFTVNGQEMWKTQWRSDYELIDPPDFPNGEQDRASYIREQLVRHLGSVAVSPFDSASWAMMADVIDSTYVRNPPEEQISVSFGYETYLVLIWRAREGDFHLLWGCC